ncbi:MAG: ABC transporter permease [Thomasclavelia sp.]|jgi:teichoic acid transport system permease protein|nr:ABC transporter permease [Thomasclavelia sp.]
MLESIKYVVKENATNLFRIYSISKYELLSDMRDSRLGVFWNFANPAIQIITYYFVFGLILQRSNVNGVPFIQWMLCGMVVWFFISPCITQGANAVFSKTNVITKMKFPVSILPATVVCKELFNHLCLMVLLIIFLLTQGITPSWYWLELLYYLPAAIIFSISLSMITSVLNMLARDTRKFILATMRLLLYLTPILWPIDRLKQAWMMPIRYIMKANPIYYIVCGYRDAFIYHHGIMFYWKQMLFFWVITAILFVIGCGMMYKFKHKFIDLI